MKNGHSEKTTPLSKDPAGIPKRMQQARISRGLGLRELSEFSGVRPIALSAIENGKPGYSLHDLNRARKALGLSFSYVMDGEEGMVKAIKDFKDDIVCSRDAFGLHVNIPQRIVRHSPTGFNWGYGGSGPADLALNILSVFIGQEAAESLYQDFKREFIAPMPFQGGTIPREAILNWVKEKDVEKSNKQLALAKVGIAALVDEATGYQNVREKDALNKLAKSYMKKEKGP
jgi:transcriptional regulator with XRE-family HTH domain